MHSSSFGDIAQHFGYKRSPRPFLFKFRGINFAEGSDLLDITGQTMVSHFLDEQVIS